MSNAVSSPVRLARARALRVSAWLVGFGAAIFACAAETPPDTPLATIGQSGTEEPAVNGDDHPSCPCGYLSNPLRGTITGLDQRNGSVRVRVDELLGSATGLEPGSEIEGTWYGDLPCFYGCASVAVGDEVLAFYRFPEPCIARSGDDCAQWANTTPPYTVPAAIQLAPWGDRVVLARVTPDLTISVDDLAMLDAPFEECAAVLGRTSDLLDPGDVVTSCLDPSTTP